MSHLYQERHRWCLGKVIECFGPQLADEGEFFMKRDESLGKFYQLFKGEISKLFVFYQYSSTDKKELSLSDGSDVDINSKCCYFMRNVSNGPPVPQQIDASKSGDSDVLFGELGDSALESIEALLSHSYIPMLALYDQWGKVDEEQKKDFKTEFELFILSIKDTLDSLQSGLVLIDPRKEILEQAALDMTQQRLRERPNEDIMNHFTSVMNQWCDHIERFIKEGEDFNDIRSSGHRSAGDTGGPRRELLHWRNRMQRMTSITEQLKRPDCKAG
jgi:hypothetical protein